MLSKFSKPSAILKHGGEDLVKMTSIVHLSLARTNQNARIIWGYYIRSYRQRLCVITVVKCCGLTRRSRVSPQQKDNAKPLCFGTIIWLELCELR